LQPFVDQMNTQANEMDEWREKIISRLRLPLLDQTLDPSGEYYPLVACLTILREYQNGLDAQEEASSYQEVLRQAVAGRIQCTTGFLNELVRDDILRQKNLGLEMTPLQEELWKRREEIQPRLDQSDPPLPHEWMSLKGAIDYLRNLVGTIGDDVLDLDLVKASGNWRQQELALGQDELKRLQQCLTDQTKANLALER
jgi:hypothetical protein